MRTLAILLCLLLGACAVTPKEDKTTYKISIGKKCSKDNTTYSWLWMIDTVGDEPVKAKYCK